MSRDTGNAIVTDDPNCDSDPSWIRADEAARQVLAKVRPITQVETVAVRETLGRVIARDLKSRVAVPNHNNSAMDGYALRGGDLPPDGFREFQVVGKSMAGDPFSGSVEQGQCVRIMTGAVMPEGTDTVVMQERVTLSGNMASVGHRE